MSIITCCLRRVSEPNKLNLTFPFFSAQTCGDTRAREKYFSEIHLLLLAGGDTLNYIEKYLQDPMAIGVYQTRFYVFFSNFGVLSKGLEGTAGKKEVKKLAAKVEELKTKREFRDSETILDEFYKVLFFLASSKTSPESLKRWMRNLPITSFSELKLRIFSSTVLSREKSDVVQIEKVFPEYDFHLPSIDLLPPIHFDATSIKKVGVSELLECVKSISLLGVKVGVLKQIRQTFSSRFTFRPYPLAVRLWLQKRAHTMLPKDLRDFLEGAVKYHESKEWRTSIVLSAIAVESLLADLYENHYRRFAPRKATLGDLYVEVKKKNIFPDKISEGISMVNDARIAAVHRSRYVVADREATNALYGATNFVLWYCLNY